MAATLKMTRKVKWKHTLTRNILKERDEEKGWRERILRKWKLAENRHSVGDTTLEKKNMKLDDEEG